MKFKSLVLIVFLFLGFGLSAVSYAQTKLKDPACVFELGELSPGTPIALINFNLPDHLKIPLIDLTRLRIKLAQGSDQAYLHHHYLNELKKLKEIFLAQGYTEEFFNDTRTFFFRELSQRDETLELEIEIKTSLAQKQKDDLSYPLKGRTRQVIEAIVAVLQIPEEDVTIEDLESITVLNLNHKNITELRAGDFEGFTNLKTLFLHHNQLTGLPQNLFQGLGALVWLYLNNNKLTGLPQTVFWDLKALQGLFLNHNQLTALPETQFQELVALERLELRYNQFTELPEAVFRGLGALQWLDLSYNQLTGLPQNLFQGLGALKELDLSSNQLTGLPQNVLWAPGELRWLSLSSNQLKELPQNMFQGLRALEWFFLSGNPITVISESVFSAPGLNQNSKIILYGLPLNEHTKQMLREKYSDRIEWRF